MSRFGAICQGWQQNVLVLALIKIHCQTFTNTPIHTHLCHVLLEAMPVGLNDLKHHVVLKVLHKVEHALAQSKGRGVPAGAGLVPHLGLLVAHPHTDREVEFFWFHVNLFWHLELSFGENVVSSFLKRFPDNKQCKMV